MLVNFVVVFFVVWLLPGLNVIDPLFGSVILDVLVASLLLALLNTFVKPVLQVLTGRLTIITLGAFGILLDSFVLLLLILLLPNRWQVQNIFSVILGGILIGVLIAFFEAVFGLDKPIVDAKEYGRTYWRILSRLPVRRRNWFIENLRFQQTYTIFYRYFADILASRTPFYGLRHRMQRWIYPDIKQTDELTNAQKVRLMLQDLGPTYVKIGQMASSRAELLPPDYAAEFAKLQSTVRPFPYAQVVEMISKELKAPPEQLFTSFERDPMAAASTAQVHRAVLPTGEHVVVKVQRPDIVPQVSADLGVMAEFANVLHKRHILSDSIDAQGIVAEFGDNVMRELDYQNEAYNARRLAYNMQAIPGVHVPVIYGKFTTSKILTMELVKGVKLIEVDKMDQAGLDRPQLARTFIRAIMKQVLVDGFFHGDPHPGNLLVNLDTGIIQFLDLGMVGEIDLQQRLSLGDLLFSLQSKDPAGIASALLGVSVPFRPTADAAAFRKAIEKVITRYMVFAEEGASLSEVLGAVLSSLSDNGFRLNPNMTLAVKVIIQIEEVMRTLNPAESMVFGAIEEAQVVLKQEVTPEKISEMAKQQITNVVRDAVHRLPDLQEASLKWLDTFQKGRIELYVDSSDLDRHVERLHISAERIMVSVILAGILIGGAITMTAPVDNRISLYIQLIIFAGMTATTALGLWLVVRVLWNSFKEERQADRTGKKP
jgi:ubiquinone biosynthesis protein